jgi:Fe-S-cluster containining protein
MIMKPALSEAEGSGPTKGTCDGCGGKCCGYVCMELDAPKKVRDFEEMVYYLYHRDVRIVVAEGRDDERTWYVEFATRCRHLDARGRCLIYERRPRVCRDHRIDGCEHHHPESFTNIASVEELLGYIRRIGKQKIARKLAERLPDEILESPAAEVAAR